MTKKEALQAMKKATDCMYNLEQQLRPVSDFIYEKFKKNLKGDNVDNKKVVLLDRIDYLKDEHFHLMLNTIKEVSRGIEEHIESSEEDS